jgi:acyl carrier protein
MTPKQQSGTDSLSEDVLQLVYAAIDEVNEQSMDGVLLEKTPDTRLLGGKGGVDSLTFVNLIVALEEQIQNSLGKSVVLVNEDTMSLREHPFRTVGTLASYVETIVAN